MLRMQILLVMRSGQQADRSTLRMQERGLRCARMLSSVGSCPALGTMSSRADTTRVLIAVSQQSCAAETVKASAY